MRVSFRQGFPAALVLVALITTVDAWTWRTVQHPDVILARRAADVLFSPDWAWTYIRVPLAQMGPLSIGLSRLPHDLYVALVAALVLPFLLVAATPLQRDIKAYLWLTAACGVIVPGPSSPGRAMPTTLWCSCAPPSPSGAWNRARTRWWPVGLCGVAGLAKPTAVLLLPLLATSPITLAAAAAVLAVTWLPFAVASPTEFLAAGKGVMQVHRHSLWGELGMHHALPPGWLRPLQFGLALALGTGAALGRRPGLALLLAFTVRSVFEMNPAPAYAASMVALALVADARTPWRLPLLTAFSLVAFWVSQSTLDGAPGWLRVAAHLVVLGLALALIEGSPRDGSTRRLGIRRCRPHRQR